MNFPYLKFNKCSKQINIKVNNTMKHVHWIGTGLSSLPGIRRLAKNLENLTIWNRTLEKAKNSINHVNKNNVKEKKFDMLPVNIIGLCTHVQELLHQVLDAYMELDVEKAMKIWESDVETDRLYLSIFKETLQAMTEDSDNVKMMTHLIFMSKNLERIGDYTTSIAKQTYFLIEGKVHETKRPKEMTTFLLSYTTK